MAQDDQIAGELMNYQARLTSLNNEIRDGKEQLQQVINNANAVSGVVQYLTAKLAASKDESNGGNTDQHDSHAGSQSDGGADSAVLD